ncbi:hypothetical protein PV10_07736 [Exophiala mesophila]|uniref:Uncharacterized protein n=1 Tax=Exophiala mesophila TaxID=212818 RepID=A0A0D1Z6F5_EXOME|nr:uncharacterized protein PV10_07736 [Exophiala mesophila]KIV90427.1 hypothetical protein PV10_07736 [Exophiala mesophila]
MPHKMRFTTMSTTEMTTLPEVCKLAWHTFYGMQKASEDFENLRFEVWTVAISLDALHSVGTTSLLIDRQADHARWALTFSKILTSLGSALRPLYNLVRQYLMSSSKERTTIKTWLLHTDVTFDGLTVQDFRRKLSMLVESLNVFLSCLTHAELARARELSESEEYRVLSEVTRTVLHKWDADIGTNGQRSEQNPAGGFGQVGYTTTTTTTTTTNTNGNSNSNIKNESSGTSYPRPGVPPSPLRPTYNQTQSAPRLPPQRLNATTTNTTTTSTSPSNTKGLNIEDIEIGFRTHLHAMRRIREQLHHQSINSGHPEDQHSPRFMTVNSGRSNFWGGQAPLTPTTPTLHNHPMSSPRQGDLHRDRGYPESTSSVSSNQSQHEGGSSTNTSDSGSVVGGTTSTTNGTVGAATAPTTGMFSPTQARHSSRPLVQTTVPSPQTHRSTPAGAYRKRKRISQYRFKTGAMDADQAGSHSSDGEGSADGSDDLVEDHGPRGVLEQMLTAVLFFDQ